MVVRGWMREGWERLRRWWGGQFGGNAERGEGGTYIHDVYVVAGLVFVDNGR